MTTCNDWREIAHVAIRELEGVRQDCDNKAALLSRVAYLIERRMIELEDESPTIDGLIADAVCREPRGGAGVEVWAETEKREKCPHCGR